MSELDSLRADKWLWAARFYRTRTLARDAIEGGKVHHAGERIKVSKELRVGMELTIRQGYDEKTVIVMALSDVRGNATAASVLYEETPESVVKRELFTQMRKLDNLARPDTRPSKQARRQIHRFQRQVATENTEQNFDYE